MPAQLLLYAGAALLVGGLAVRHLVLPGAPRLRWPALGLLLLVLGAAWKTYGVLNELDMLNPTDTLDFLTRVPAGRAVLILVMGGCVLLAAHLSRFSRLTELGAAAVTLWGLAGLGHGAMHGDFVRAAHVLHAGAMSVWVAGVATLLLARPLPEGSLRRFSTIAAACVAGLIVSGITMGLNHAGPPLALPDSLYGRRLLLKVMLFGGILLLAFLIRKTMSRNGGVHHLLMSEFVLLAAILMLTASLVGLPPPSHSTFP